MKKENKFLVESRKHAIRHQRQALRSWCIAISVILTAVGLCAMSLLVKDFNNQFKMWHSLVIFVLFYLVPFYMAKQFVLGDPILTERQLKYLHTLQQRCPSCDMPELKEAIQQLLVRKARMNTGPISD